MAKKISSRDGWLVSWSLFSHDEFSCHSDKFKSQVDELKAKVTNSFANRTNSITKVTNLIAETCTVRTFSYVWGEWRVSMFASLRLLPRLCVRQQLHIYHCFLCVKYRLCYNISLPHLPYHFMISMPVHVKHIIIFLLIRFHGPARFYVCFHISRLQAGLLHISMLLLETEQP